jgi:hypothetical protein
MEQACILEWALNEQACADHLLETLVGLLRDIEGEPMRSTSRRCETIRAAIDAVRSRRRRLADRPITSPSWRA